MDYEDRYLRRGLVKLTMGIIMILIAAIISGILAVIHDREVEKIKTELNR